MCSMPWRQVSILNENKEKTPQLQYECDVFSCHGRGNPAPSNFRLDAHAHKLGRILLHEFAVPFRPLVAGGIVRHENNVAVLIHLFLPPSVPLSPGIVACFGGTSPSLSHGLSLFKRTFTLWSNVFSTEEDSSSDFGRDELRMTPGFAVRYEKSLLPEAFEWSGQRDSNPRSQPWQGCALPTKLCPQVVSTVVGNE